MVTSVTNNPLLRETRGQCRLVEGEVLDVLRCARDLIHTGCRLLLHPLAGNVRPEQLLYKTLVLSEPFPVIDQQSLDLIETAIAAVGRPGDGGDRRRRSEAIQQDLQLLDADLVRNAMPALFVADR